MNSSKLTTYIGFKTQYVTESYVNYLLVRKYRNVYEDSDPQPIVWQLNEVDIQILLKNHVFVHIVKI